MKSPDAVVCLGFNDHWCQREAHGQLPHYSLRSVFGHYLFLIPYGFLCVFSTIRFIWFLDSSVASDFTGRALIEELNSLLWERGVQRVFYVVPEDTQGNITPGVVDALALSHERGDRDKHRASIKHIRTDLIEGLEALIDGFIAT
jgi:hypothetical protein